MEDEVNRKAILTLYADPTCHYSHRARFVLSEKSASADVEYINPRELPEDLQELNPYGTLPILIDRDLSLFNSRIIMEYLDERFPHPPLYPVDPVSRARSRLLIHRIDQDWYTLLDDVINAGEKKAAKAKKLLRENLIAAVPLFTAKSYFLSDDFTLVDAVLAPLLWRLPLYGIEFPAEAKVITTYTARVTARENFQNSLSDAEREMMESYKLLSA
ncbi:MAG: stringent starvation protein A [Cycloclasticus sp. symbiont of Poecilosclerida sp. M]|nr:MAG: stringent starvation protein A [Cycloclasticus sp. symbiont of Poecilosclerida sp. M]